MPDDPATRELRKQTRMMAECQAWRYAAYWIALGVGVVVPLWLLLPELVARIPWWSWAVLGALLGAVAYQWRYDGLTRD